MSAADSNATRTIMRRRPFAGFWCSRVGSTMAYQVLAVAVGWQMYALTGSALALGLVGLVQFVPAITLALVVGQIADRFHKPTIVRLCQAIEGLAASALALGSATGWLDENAIFLLVALVGAARAFEAPTQQALVPALVPPGLLPRAVAWSASANQTAVIVGPALGGLIYALGPAAAYGASAALFLLAAVAIGFVRIGRVAAEREPVSLRSLVAGIAFIRGRPVVLGALSLDLFAVLLGGATALLPIYARDILATGPWGLGVLRSAPAAGALAMSIFLARRPLGRRVGRTMFAAVAVFGLATIVFGLSRSLALSLGALALLGAADMISVVIRLSMVQIETPDPMRGRVSAVNAVFTDTSNRLGEFESGLTAAWFGTVPAVLIGGIGTLVVVMIWMRAFPALARFDRLE